MAAVERHAESEAAALAGSRKFETDPGVLEGAGYSKRTREIDRWIDGVGMIAGDVRSIKPAQDYAMAMMTWKGEAQKEARRSTGSMLVLHESWGRLAQELRDQIIECSIAASPPTVYTSTPGWCPRDVLGRQYLRNVIYEGARPTFFQCSRLHFRVLDLDFAPVIDTLRGLTRSSLGAMLQNRGLSITLDFSRAYDQAANADGVWPWVEFCGGVERKFGGRRIPWRYLALEGDDILHMDFEIWARGQLDGAPRPAELEAIIGGMQEAPLRPFM